MLIDHPSDTVSHMCNVKVQQITKRKVSQSQITQYLRKMYFVQLVYRF